MRKPPTGARVTVIMTNGDKVTGTVEKWTTTVRLTSPLNIIPKFAVQSWTYSS